MSFTDEKCLSTWGRYSLERGINTHPDRSVCLSNVGYSVDLAKGRSFLAASGKTTIAYIIYIF